MEDRSEATVKYMGFDPDFMRGCAYRPPNWRHRRAEYLLRPGSVAPLHSSDDDATRRQYFFLKAYRECLTPYDRSRLFKRHDSAFRAACVWAQRLDGDNTHALSMETRQLAGQPSGDIAYMTPTPKAAVELYGQVYFDVAGNIEMRDWIHNSVLMPALTKANWGSTHSEHMEAAASSSPIIVVSPHFDGSIKFLAWMGGAAVVDLLLTGMPAKLTRPTVDGYDRWLETVFRQTISKKAVQTAIKMPVTRYSIEAIFTQYTNLRNIERAFDSGTAQHGKDVAETVKAILTNQPPGIMDPNAAETAARIGKRRGAAELRLSEQHVALAGGVPKHGGLDSLPPPRPKAAKAGTDDGFLAGL